MSGDEEHTNSEPSNNDSTYEEGSKAENHDEPNNRRTRNEPGYLHDYVTGQKLDEQIEQHNLAVFSTNSDPVIYEEAVKHKDWRKEMDQ